jgi:hypothetical protein
MKTSRRSRLLLLAPLVILAHVAEEAPGLVAWSNRHLEPDLTMSDFFALNAIGLLVTVLIAVPSVRSRNYLLALGLIAWLSFVMLANGVIHLTASLLFREYVPGTVTAGILYLPYFVAATVTVCRNFDVRPRAAILAATIGAVPMLAQGIGILTVGRRLLW